MRVLLVEDDPYLGEALRRGVESGSCRVDWIRRGDDLLAADVAGMYDVVLLDLGLPHMSGIDALKALRARRDITPVIIITAQDRPEQKIAGLDAGADDYLVKPVDLHELLARIRAQVRRREARATDRLTAGAIGLDIASRTAWKNDEHIAITAKEYALLALLMRRIGRFVSKSDIEADLYDDAAGVDSNTIEVLVSGLRRKFGKEAILTARGLGYMVPK